MLYLITTGRYSDYSIVDVVESELGEAEVLALYRERAQLKAESRKKNEAGFIAWLLDNPVLRDGTLINIGPPPRGFGSARNYYADGLYFKASSEYYAEHPDQELEDNWLVEHGIRPVLYDECHLFDYSWEADWLGHLL